MKDANKFALKHPLISFMDKIFWNEELWENEHVLYAMRCTRRILDTNDQKSDLSRIMS